MLAVLGPNGAGKSTALHVIAGLVRPDSGVVRRRRPRARPTPPPGCTSPTHDRRVGLLLQDPLLFPHLSVAANVAFAPRSGQRRPRRLARSPHTGSTEVDAAELADRMPRQLSGGQAQRVALARALAAEPDVLLLDEPLAGLDVAAATAMRKVLRRVLARDGRSAVLITHDLLDVLTLADRVLVLESGRIVETGRRQRFWRHPEPVRRAVRRGEPGRRHRGRRWRAATQWGTTWHGSPGARRGGRRAGGGACSSQRRSPCTATSRTAALATPSR